MPWRPRLDRAAAVLELARTAVQPVLQHEDGAAPEQSR